MRRNIDGHQQEHHPISSSSSGIFNNVALKLFSKQLLTQDGNAVKAEGSGWEEEADGGSGFGSSHLAVTQSDGSKQPLPGKP